MKQFKVTRSTALKLNSTEQSINLGSHQFLTILENSVITTDDHVVEKDGHLELKLRCYFYKDHLQEINLDSDKNILEADQEYFPFYQGKLIFGDRYTQLLHEQLNDCLNCFFKENS